jgi:PAS domain S-box-containing protein
VEDYYKNLIHYLPDIVYQLDVSGNFSYVNSSVSSLGFKPEELLGKHFARLIAPVDAVQVIGWEGFAGKRESDAQARPSVFNERRTGERITKHLKVMLRGRDDQVRSGEVFATGIYRQEGDAQPSCFGTIGIIRIYGSSELSDKTFLSVEKYYRMIIDNSSETIFIVAHDGTILSVSNSLQKSIGISSMDIIGENFLSLIHPDQKQSFKMILSGKMIVPQKRKVEFRLRNSGGRLSDFESTVFSVNDISDSEVACFIFHAVDISMRKEIERALERRERIYKTLLRISPEAVILCDREGDVIMANDRASEILRASRDDLVGMHYLTFVDGKHTQDAGGLVSQVKVVGSVRDRRLTVIAADSARVPVELSVSVLQDQSGTPESYMLVFRDITQTVASEEKNRRLERELLDIILGKLSAREIELLKFLWMGYRWPDQKREIGKKMDVVPGTLDQFLARIRKKFGDNDLSRVVMIAAKGYGWNDAAGENTAAEN